MKKENQIEKINKLKIKPDFVDIYNKYFILLTGNKH